MNNWRWGNPRSFRDQVGRYNPQLTSLGKVKPTGDPFSLYGSYNLRAKIEAPSCPQYKAGNFLGVTQLNRDEIIDEDDDDGNWLDVRALSGGKSRPSDGNDNDDGDSKEDTQGC